MRTVPETRPKLTIAEYELIPDDGRRAGEGFTRPVELSAEHRDVAEIPILPDLRLELARLFA